MSDELDRHVVAYEGRSIYDFDNRILLDWYSRRILELTTGASSLLELGLGHGFTAQVFGGRFERYRILEGSQAVIANFRKNFPGLDPEIVQTSFDEYAAQEKFDVVVMGFVLEHVEDPVGLLRRYQGLVAPEGSVFVAVPNAETMNRRLGNLAGILPDLSQLSQNDLDLGHRRSFTTESLTKTIRDAGGRVERLEGIFLKPLTTAQLLSLDLDERILEGMCQLGVDYPELSCGLLAEVAFA
jgi:trans-aconitate methyltransferase